MGILGSGSIHMANRYAKVTPLQSPGSRGLSEQSCKQQRLDHMRNTPHLAELMLTGLCCGGVFQHLFYVSNESRVVMGCCPVILRPLLTSVDLGCCRNQHIA